MLDAKADPSCKAEEYQRSETHTDTRAGHYQRKPQSLQFENLLDELLGVGAMSPPTRGGIEQLRLTLNTDHHNWTHRSHKEKIGIDEDMLRCAYEDL